MEFFKHEVKKNSIFLEYKKFFQTLQVKGREKKEKNMNLKNINFWKHIKMKKSKSFKPIIKMEKVIKSDDTENLQTNISST